MKVTEKQIEEILSKEDYYGGDYNDYIIGFRNGFNKSLSLFDGSQQRELLISFMKYYNDKTEMHKLGINDFEIDDFLKN